ncbi:cell division protein FtsL [Deinococcus reticulitermitis]|uniref:Cell division protein FtsL n=1 Tax=Deinococcus reticulitermitis TaxID=856736 RepID=A0A1H6VSF8_9DEIO|nr:hypothetical protein [Deinococcus reticulitermitis]SEJ04737.1 cell division protein FtsL [Deinococcus reticulitermitis]
MTRRPPDFWWSADPELWRARTVRLLLAYLLLALTLLGTRYATRDVRPTLLQVREQEKTLTKERDQLETEVQFLVSPQRVRLWAERSGMVLFANVPKTRRDLGELPLAPAPLPPEEPLKVNIQWN